MHGESIVWVDKPGVNQAHWTRARARYGQSSVMENGWIKENDKPGDGRLLFRIRLESSTEENQYVCVSIEDLAPFKKLQEFVCEQVRYRLQQKLLQPMSSCMRPGAA